MALLPQISSAPLGREAVFVPQWGCTLYAHEMDVGQRSAYQDAIRGLRDAAEREGRDPDPNELTAVLLSRSVRDEGGTPVCGDDDAAEIRRQSGDGVERLLAAAVRVNHFGPAAEEAAKKKSVTPSGDSGNASPGSAGSPTPT